MRAESESWASPEKMPHMVFEATAAAEGGAAQPGGPPWSTLVQLAAPSSGDLVSKL